MCRHIIISLKYMGVDRVVFGDQLIEEGIHVDPYRGIRIFIQREPCRSMLDQYMHQPGFWQGSTCTQYIPGDQVATPRVRSQCNLVLYYHGKRSVNKTQK